MQMWLWLKAVFLKLTRARIVVHIHKLDVVGKPVTHFGLNEQKAIAETYSRVPGLEQSLTRSIGEAIQALDEVKKHPDNFGEIVRQSQRVIELWGFLKIPEMATAEVEKILEQMERDQKPGEKQVTQSTVM